MAQFMYMIYFNNTVKVYSIIHRVNEPLKIMCDVGIVQPLMIVCTIQTALRSLYVWL